MTTPKLHPVLFAGHGSPVNAIEDNVFRRQWQTLGKELPRPKAILAISAHWYTRGTYTQSAAKPKQIYDFYGFPKPLYEIQYPVQGDEDLTHQVLSLLGDSVQINDKWGIDHGTWSVLSAMYPHADIPVVQLSIDQNISLEDCYKLGQKLKPLREQGVLIFGSGNVVHSFQYVKFDMETGYDWAVAFDEAVSQWVKNGEHERVWAYEKEGLEHRKAFQTLEHYAPLLYVLGAAESNEPVMVFNQACIMGSMSMTSFVIGDTQ